MRPFLLAWLMVVCAGCGSGGRPPASPERTADARVAVAAIEADLKALAGLDPAQRAAAERAFGPRLEDALGDAANTPFENHIAYWLACWRFEQPRRDLRAVEWALDVLDGCESPAYQGMGRFLRMRCRLIQGRIEDAQRIGERVAEAMPELQPQRWVSFHRLAGAAAPPLPAGIAPVDGAVVLLFLPAADAAARFIVDQHRAAMPAGTAMRMVVLGGTPLDTLRLGGDAVWIAPGDRQALTDAWQLPALPTAVALGPVVDGKRRILAVEVRPGDLGQGGR